MRSLETIIRLHPKVSFERSWILITISICSLIDHRREQIPRTMSSTVNPSKLSHFFFLFFFRILYCVAIHIQDRKLRSRFNFMLNDTLYTHSIVFPFPLISFGVVCLIATYRTVYPGRRDNLDLYVFFLDIFHLVVLSTVWPLLLKPWSFVAKLICRFLSTWQTASIEGFGWWSQSSSFFFRNISTFADANISDEWLSERSINR